MKINRLFLMLWIPFIGHAQPPSEELFTPKNSEEGQSCGIIPMMDPGAGAGMRV